MAPSLCFVLLVVAAFAGQCASAASPLRMGKRYIVAEEKGWRVPPRANKDMYMKWASGINFYVEDSVEFVYKNDSVVKVNKVGYYHCNETAPADKAAPRDGSTLFLLDEPGYVYFSSADLKHCKKGQRLMVKVEAGPAPETAPTTALPPAPSPGSSMVMGAAASSFFASSVHVLVSVTLAFLVLV